MPRPPHIPKRKLPTPMKVGKPSLQLDVLLQNGLTLHQNRQYEEAKLTYSEILQTEPNHFDAVQLLGTIAVQVGDYKKAVDLLLRAIGINAKYAPCHNNLGLALQATMKFEEALASYDRAIALNASYIDAYSNKGNVLQSLKRLEEALASYDKAIAIQPNYAEAYFNRGIALQALKRTEEAVASYDRAIAIKPDYADAHRNRGNALKELLRLEEALESYNQLIAYKPEQADGYSNRGIAFQELKRYKEALESYGQAYKLNPDHPYLFGLLQHLKMFVCDWSNFEGQIHAACEKIIQHQRCSVPFTVLSLIDSPLTQLECAKTYTADKHPRNNSLGPIEKRSKGQRIRIGYFSADYHNSAAANLMIGIFDAHDKAGFELVAFTFGPDKQDEMRSRLINTFDHFIDVRDKSDEEIADLSRSMQIDIAVDLNGFTTGSRTSIFAHQAAPIQVSFLGYPGSMGTDYIHYVIADKTLVPLDSQRYYSEKIAYMPNSYWPNSYQFNESKSSIAVKKFSRQELGLPENGFVFCCFNNNYKITPNTFSSWMRILGAVEGSVLWLLEDNPLASETLKKEAENHNIDSKRLIFAGRMALPDHLARHSHANLFIDTLPYNAHTTASDALWAGLPVLTLIGKSFASRVAASLLNAQALTELITTTQEQYEALAIELATNPQKLAAIKIKLADHRLTTPLFDTLLFTRHLELAYKQMMERYWADLPPDHLDIGALI